LFLFPEERRLKAAFPFRRDDALFFGADADADNGGGGRNATLRQIERDGRTKSEEAYR